MREYQRLAFLKRSLLTKVSACHEHRFQFVFRFPQVFRAKCNAWMIPLTGKDGELSR